MGWILIFHAWKALLPQVKALNFLRLFSHCNPVSPNHAAFGVPDLQGRMQKTQGSVGKNLPQNLEFELISRRLSTWAFGVGSCLPSSYWSQFCFLTQNPEWWGVKLGFDWMEQWRSQPPPHSLIFGEDECWRGHGWGLGDSQGVVCVCHPRSPHSHTQPFFLSTILFHPH